MKAAIVKDGIVINVINVDPDKLPEIEGLILNEDADIGDSYENGVLIKPAVEKAAAGYEPDEIEILKALLEEKAGITAQDIEDKREELKRGHQ